MISATKPTPPALDTRSISNTSGLFNDHQLCTLWRHASLLFHDRKWRRASDCFRFCAMQTSDSLFTSLLIINVGIIATQSEDYAQALRLFDDAASLTNNAKNTEPAYCLALFLSGISLYELEHYEQARDNFKKCRNLLSVSHQVLDFRPLGLRVMLEFDHLVVNERSCSIKLLQMSLGDHGRNERSSILYCLPPGLIFESPVHSSRLSSRRLDLMGAKSASMTEKVKTEDGPSTSLCLWTTGGNSTMPTTRRYNSAPKAVSTKTWQCFLADDRIRCARSSSTRDGCRNVSEKSTPELPAIQMGLPSLRAVTSKAVLDAGYEVFFHRRCRTQTDFS